MNNDEKMEDKNNTLIAHNLHNYKIGAKLNSTSTTINSANFSKLFTVSSNATYLV